MEAEKVIKILESLKRSSYTGVVNLNFTNGHLAKKIEFRSFVTTDDFKEENWLGSSK